MNYSTKMFLWISVCILFFILSFSKQFLNPTSKLRNLSNQESRERIRRNEKFKYMLMWTEQKNEPFCWLKLGRKGFVDRECPFNNCFVTNDRELHGDFGSFDAVLFAGPEVVHYARHMLPTVRYPHQKFIFASLESPSNYPLKTNVLDGFFNWTWTYKLNSDARWGYIAIRDKQGHVIGPNTEMHWMKHEDMNPVSDDLIKRISKKSKTAAWFVSNCNPVYTPSNRDGYFEELKKELAQYNLTVDVYGKCGTLQCGLDQSTECERLIERDYYFYLAFENSFSEDYVTEKLLHALQNNAVPIVYGGANYTRFMPPDIYLDARKMGAKNLAKRMFELVNDRAAYLEYFRWTSHYSYHDRNEARDTNDYCKFCEVLNNATLMRTTTVYKDLREWWAPHDNLYNKS